MSSFKEVSARLRVIAKDIPENANAIVRLTALAIQQSLVLQTPVDTGRARANWQVNINAPANGTLEQFPLAAKGDSVGLPGPSGSFAMTEAIKATQNFVGGSIFITNNLPYIVPLNNGHSQQAPAGFIQTAILNGIAAVKNATLIEKPKGYGE